MATVTGGLTYQDLCRVREDGNRYELIEGELILVAAPSPWHQRLLLRLALVFHQTVTETGLGEVFIAPLDVRLEGQSFVQPDLLVVFNERVSIIRPTMIEGAPDLIVEIISASSRVLDRTRQLALYARAGVREYWLIETDARRITIHADPSSDRFATVATADRGETARSTILSSLAVAVDSLFLGLPAGT